MNGSLTRGTYEFRTGAGTSQSYGTGRWAAQVLPGVHPVPDGRLPAHHFTAESDLANVRVEEIGIACPRCM